MATSRSPMRGKQLNASDIHENGNGNWENSKHLIVNMSVPKFDVVSDLDLRDGLNALGITGVFDATVADFSPMTSKVAEIFLSKAYHRNQASRCEV